MYGARARVASDKWEGADVAEISGGMGGAGARSLLGQGRRNRRHSRTGTNENSTAAPGSIRRDVFVEGIHLAELGLVMGEFSASFKTHQTMT